MKILFICTGNTCRSPMAEALLNHKVPEFKVQSAGIYAGENERANQYAIEVLKDAGITCHHTSQSVTNELLNWADLVLTMTVQHKQLLVMQYPDDQEKYFTLKEYVYDADSSTMNDDISDPFGGELPIYQETFKELDTYIELLINKLFSRRKP